MASLPIKLKKKKKLITVTNQMTQPRCLELFAGCGGLGYGFHKEGFQITVCNELEEQIAETYQENFPDTKVVVGDITNNDLKQKLIASFKKIPCDVILGGPPCVAYSMAGKRNSRDPRGQLFKDYIEMVDKLKPKVFVMENVKGILTMLHDKPTLTKEEGIVADAYYELEKEKIELEAGKQTFILKNKKEKNVEYINEILEIKQQLILIKKEQKTMIKNNVSFRMKVTEIIKTSFEDLGYNVEYKLLNSADFGVPQKRERVIFIGVRKDIKKDICFPEETHNPEGTDGKQKWVSVREAIDDLKNKEEDTSILQHIFTDHSPAFIEKIKNTPIGKSVNPKYQEAFFRCYPEKPSTTVKENHGGVFVHYEKNRVMTPRELARLQSFPDDFKFCGSKSNILVQLGNAVPCGLSHAIAKEIKKLVD